ncbi:mannose-6-phosphate isomerase [Aequitasia blattaphilus]|uniref:Class I mannose-6-phosphate isomerase n=1 Tax=Aequitasia blattaphilus TaxID=2949332 RepID=A0ABT1E8C4_9FIRM|nr:class I mannose-6-phosphate isomerase [Aequitasia blattaphilus]MCP1102070.1 class I mannose-6-phosphate isomerase [Aequitasia blattaphilus]MCR8614710.1 class I mannose-6-phosphate isomerase [Aequitasia blattaphilus]
MNALEKELTKQPIFLERNRVGRVYKGGLLFHDFLGDEKEDSYLPEEWVASTVQANNPGSTIENEGLSIIKDTKITLKELIENYPDEMLGGKKNFNVLVKYLDSGIRLPIQVHPDAEFSKKHFASTKGKTEMWLVLNTRKDACIYFGFKEKLTKEEFSELVERSKTEKDLMEGYLNAIPVKEGDIYLVPAKRVHAIGKGCLILEVQEPTDFTISPEYFCGEYELNDEERFCGLEREVALSCFDFTPYGEASYAPAKKIPRIVMASESYQEEDLINKEDTPLFGVKRYRIKKNLLLPKTPGVYVIVKGTGLLKGKDYQKEVKQGDYFFLPYDGGEKFELISNQEESLEVVSCFE